MKTSAPISGLTRRRSHRGAAIAGFALLAGALPLAVLAAPSGSVVNRADCPVGWFWDPVGLACAPIVAPVVGPAGPVGVDPVLGPAGPVGVGGVVGPVGVDPVLGPAGPVGVGRR